MKKLLMVAMAMGLGSSAFSQSKDLSPTVEKVFSGAFDKIRRMLGGEGIKKGG